MKFANVIHNGLPGIKENDTKKLINIGDIVQVIAIDNLYKKMGVSEEDIIQIELHNLWDYDGEYVILPINFMLMTNLFGRPINEISPKIIPVFLGVCFANEDFSVEIIAYLKRFEPIGCRDERTRDNLIRRGVDAYIQGCLGTTYEMRNSIEMFAKKIFFIDVPKAIQGHIPKDIIPRIEFLEHEFYSSVEQPYFKGSLKQFTLQRIEKYKNEAEMLVTSRFHAAVLGLGLGIPTIITIENNFYKFSWLAKYLKLYSIEDFEHIDWNVKQVNFEYEKQLMMQVAIERITTTQIKYERILHLDALMENKNKSDMANLLYYRGACEFAKKKWRKEEIIQYALWGISDNSEKIFQFMQSHFANAKLVLVMDQLRESEFKGMKSVKPTEANCKNYFVFVTSNTASEVAQQLFDSIGKAKEDYYLCRLEFLKAEDLK